MIRSKGRVDRIACQWLISRFIDRDAAVLLASTDQATKRSHDGDGGAFDALLGEHGLEHPALHVLARIVRGADTGNWRLAPEASCLYAVASGFQVVARDEDENVAPQFPIFDALYAYCRSRLARGAA